MHYFGDHPMTLRPPSWDGIGWGGKEWEGETSCLVTMKDRRMEGAGERRVFVEGDQTAARHRSECERMT